MKAQLITGLLHDIWTLTFFFSLHQISFVFTNQVEGKLTPIESKERAKIEVVERKGLSVLKRGLSSQAVLPYKTKEMSPAISFSKDARSSFSLKTLPQPHTKLMRTLEGKTKISLSWKSSASFQKPSKVLSPACTSDDDFV